METVTKAEKRGDSLTQQMEINRTNDYAFKRIMGSEEGKEALIGFLNAVPKPLKRQDRTSEELLEREILPPS